MFKLEKLQFSRKEDSSVAIDWSLRFLRSFRPLCQFRYVFTFVALAGNPALVQLMNSVTVIIIVVSYSSSCPQLLLKLTD